MAPEHLPIMNIGSPFFASIACAFFLPVAGNAAETPAPDQTSAPVSSLVKSREQRAAWLLEEIRTTDKRIENRIDTIVSGLSRIRDSRDSRTQVARLKTETMQALARSIQSYQSKRAALVEEMRRPTLRITIDQKKQIIAVFDGRIEKRVNQILELQKSFPAYEETDRFQAVGGGDAGPYFVEQEAWKQNRRMSQQTDAQRAKVVAGLEKSIGRLESQKRTLDSRAATSKNPALVELIGEEVARIDATIADRRKQIVEAHQASASGQRTVSRKEAADLDRTLREAGADLQRDIDTLFRRYNEYLRALSELDAARAAAASQ